MNEHRVLPYTYIEPHELNKNFGFCMNSQSKEFTIYFVLYEIKYLFVEGVVDPNPLANYCQEKRKPGVFISSRLTAPNTFHPYLQFVVEKKEGRFSFPSTQYTCMQPPVQTVDNGGGGDETPDKSPDQIYFETACFKQVFDMFTDISIIHDENLDIYQGFVEHTDSTVFAFFDISRLSKYIKPNYTVATVDEIFYRQKIYSTPIDPVISAFLEKNVRFIDLISPEDQSLLKFPFQLYLCKMENGQYANVVTTESTQFQAFDHPLLGYSNYFSTDPVTNENTDELVRFACFTCRVVYIKKDIVTELSQEEREYYTQGVDNPNIVLAPGLPTVENIHDASTLYFVENGLQLWSVKNILHFTEI